MGRRSSWKRAAGITRMKRDFARSTGIPTTRSGRRRKVKRSVGCCVPLLVCAAGVLAGGLLDVFG